MSLSTPASAKPLASATVLAVGTTPSIEQPKAVDAPAITSMRRGCVLTQSMSRRASSMLSAGVRLRLARLWPSLTETGKLILCAPAA